MRAFFILFCIFLIFFTNAEPRRAPVTQAFHRAVEQSIITVRKLLFENDDQVLGQYRMHYYLGPGDLFDQKKHEDGLEHIKQALRKEGYFKGTVHSSVILHDRTQEVDIVVHLERGKRFIIDTVTVSWKQCPGFEKSADLELELKAMIEPAVYYEWYTEQMFKEQIERIHLHLQQEGFIQYVLRPRLIIRPKRERVTLYFEITGGAQCRSIFTGNYFFNDAQLRDAITLVGPAVPRMAPEVAAEEIMLLYKKSGFLETTVTWQEQADTCLFIIIEGERCAIRDVQLEGIQKGSEHRIKEHFKALRSHGYYDATLLRDGCENLAQWYVQQGFWDVKFIEEKLVDVKDTHEKIIVITLCEGKQRFLKMVEVVDFPDIMQESLFKSYSTLDKPIPFDIHIVKELGQWLKHYTHNKGYLYSSFKPEFIEKEDGMVLLWRLTGPQEPVRFGKTIIRGVPYTAPHVLLKALDYQVGDVWDYEALHRSVARLKALSLFESLSLEPADIFTPETEKTLVLKVIEDDPYELRLRGGLGFISRNVEIRGGWTYRLGGSWLWKNVSRRADILRIDLDSNRYMSEASVSYRIPWPGGLPAITTLKAYASQYDQPFVIGSPDILYNAIRTGVAVRFSGKSGMFDWGLNTGIEWMKLEGVSRERARVLEFEPALVDTFFSYVMVEPTLFVVHLDDKVTPSSGYSTLLSIKGMFPFSMRDGMYVKVLAEQSYFFPLSERLVFATRLRLGHLFLARFERIMPTDRFYLGGAYSLRGYEPDLAPPLNIYRDRQGKKHLVATGGKSLFNINLELRFPLYNDLGGVLFNDLGMLSQGTISQITFDGLLGSTGFGLRYETSLGALRLDVGWKWRKRFPEDRSYCWFLTLGQAF